MWQTSDIGRRIGHPFVYQRVCARHHVKCSCPQFFQQTETGKTQKILDSDR